MRYCQYCDRSYDDDFTFCPKCSARLLSRAEAEEIIRSREREANERREKERQDEQMSVMCKKIYDVLESYGASKGVYSDISSSGDLRSALQNGNRYNDYSYKFISELYDTVIEHKIHKTEDLTHELYRKFRGIEDNIAKLKNMIRSYYGSVNPNRYYCYGDFEEAWLVGSRGYLTVECRDRSGDGYTLCYYDIEQYAFDWGMKDRFGHLPHCTFDYGPMYYMYKKEIDLIDSRVSEEIKYYQNFLNATYDRYSKLYVLRTKELLDTFNRHGIMKYITRIKQERN